MTTVAQMIEWMKTLPQDAVVECGCQDDYRSMTLKPVDTEACYVYDFSTPEYRENFPQSKRLGKIFVEIRAE